MSVGTNSGYRSSNMVECIVISRPLRLFLRGVVVVSDCVLRLLPVLPGLPFLPVLSGTVSPRPPTATAALQNTAVVVSIVFSIVFWSTPIHSVSFPCATTFPSIGTLLCAVSIV